MYKILLFILFSTLLHSQVNVLKTNENSSKVQYQIRIDQIVLPDISYNLEQRLSPYFDFSKPGEIVLPSFELLFIIPSENIKSFDYNVISENSRAFSPAVNPSRNRVNDTIYSIDYDPQIKRQKTQNSLLEFKGYFWYRHNRIAHFSFNPFRYSAGEGKLITTESISIAFDFGSNIFPVNQSFYNTAEKFPSFAMNFVNPEDYDKFTPQVNHSVSDSTFNWIDFGKDYLKIGIGKDGIYRVTGNELLSSGVVISSINPASFKLESKGKSVPIFVNDRGDGIFNQDDYIEFLGVMNYGSPLYRTTNPPNTSFYEYLDRNSDTTIYWLSWGWNQSDNVVLQTAAQLSSTDTLKYYTHFLHSESQVNYNTLSADPLLTELPFWNDKKSWYGQPIFVGTQSFSFTASNIYPGQPVRFFLKYASLGGSIQNNAHQIGFRLNSNPVNVDSQNVNAYQTVILSGAETSDSLINGTNRLIVQNYQNENTANILYSDWYEVEYPRKTIAVADSGMFRFGDLSSQGISTFRIDSVRTDSLLLWSLDSGVYKKIFVNKDINSAVVSDTINSNRKYFYDNGLSLNPVKIYYKKRFVNLRDQSEPVDYLLVTAKPLIEASVQHAEYIAGKENVRTKIIDIDDVVDEFAFGQLDPEALRSFMKYTIENWPSPKPGYLFLVGQANFDLKRNVTRFSNVPSKTNLVFTYGAPGSDNAFGIFDTTGAFINQFFIGRFPARTPQDLIDYTNTLKNYNQQRFTEWNKIALLFSGGNFNDPNQIEQFRLNNQSIADTLFSRNPYGMGVTHFYKTVNPATSLGPYTPEQVKSALDKGGLLFSYVGHSGVQTWDNGIGSPEQLYNKENKNPLVTDFGCATGLHSLPDVNSFSELFMLSQSSKAIAYIANSSLGFVSTSATAPALFYSTIFRDSVFKISDALQKTKQKLNDKFGATAPIKVFGFSSTLFGDPTLRLAIPGKPNFVINNSDLELLTAQPDDLSDSVEIKATFKNIGSVYSDSLSVLVNLFYENNQDFTVTIKKMIPEYSDSIFLKLPVNKRAGNYKLEVLLNNDNRIDELYKDDNSSIIEFQVYSTEFRFNLQSVKALSTNRDLNILNPKSLNQTLKLVYQVADNPLFNNAAQNELQLGENYSVLPLNNLEKNKRYWIRIKNSGAAEFQNPVTLKYSDKPGYLINDSTAFFAGILKNVTVDSEGLKLDSLSKQLKVESAGYYAGALGVIDVGGQNFVAENTIPGFHFCTFNRDDLSFIEYKVLAYNATTQQVNEIVDFLNGLDSTKLLAGVVSVTATRYAPVTTILQSLGSKFVQNVGYRHSWAFLTWKGASETQVKEVWKTGLAGPAKFDTTFTFNYNSGSFETEVLGPVKMWNYMTLNKTGSFNNLKTKILGIKTDNSIDTLSLNVLADSTNLASVDAKVHPRIKLVFDFVRDQSNALLNAIYVNAESQSELSINNYNLLISKDTISINDSLVLSFNIYNSGSGTADSFKVFVELENPDKSKEIILDEMVIGLSSGQLRTFNPVIRANQKSGTKKLRVTLDPQNYVPEFYEDNNTAEVTFTEVLGFDKPFVKTQFNGQDIYDGDFVSNKPEITVDLYDPSTSGTVDTTLIRLLLNNKRIFMSSPEVTFSLRNTNPRVSLSYKPTLAAGEYELKVTGTGASGTPIDSAGSVRNFVVSDENKILQVYNYPNPFVSETYFTFKATNLPDEVQILIYTVAGRMIKKISKTAADLRYDFNKIYWDGRDEDGDIIASGTYLYRVIMKKNGETQTVTEKLSVVR